MCQRSRLRRRHYRPDCARSPAISVNWGPSRPGVVHARLGQAPAEPGGDGDAEFGPVPTGTSWRRGAEPFFRGESPPVYSTHSSHISGAEQSLPTPFLWASYAGPMRGNRRSCAHTSSTAGGASSALLTNNRCRCEGVRAKAFASIVS